MFREILFFLGYRLCYKTPWHTSNWSRIQWKRWNKNIYIFIFLEFSWQEPWGKLDTKHYSPLPHENEFETLSKSFFFFFFLVRETNRAMYNLQVETETRTNQYQFPVYFGPKLQPKKKKNPLLVNFVWGEEFHGTAILCWTLWNFQSHPRGAKNTVNRVSFNPLTSTPSVKVPYLAYARHLIWLDTFSYMVNPI